MKKLLWLLIFVSSLLWANVDTVFLESDKWDAYTLSIMEVTDGTVVKSGHYTPTNYDGYWAFLISEVIHSNTIDSVKMSFYISEETVEGDEELKFWGLQQEDCDTIENQDLSAATRTTASVTQPVWNSTGQHISVDIDAIFNEWVADYSHSGSDHFGLVLDDNGLSNDRITCYDYCHGSYSNHTYLIIWYHSAEEEKKKVIGVYGGCRYF